jgi:hypothetical protein
LSSKFHLIGRCSCSFSADLNHLLFHFSNEAYLVWHNLPHAILTPEDSDTLSYIDEDGSLHDSSVIDSAVSLEMDQMAGTDTETIWRTGKGVFQGPKPVETFGVKNPKHEERKEKRMNHLRAVVDQASKQPGAPTAMTAWEKTLGQSLWPFFSSHPALGANFALGMAEVDHLVNHALVADYAWDEHGAGSKVDKLVDVGGALGSFLYEVLTAYPSIPRATLFDMDDSISQAKALWSEEQRGEYAQVRKHTKVELVAGDFFQVSSIPAPSAQGATRYVLRQILHDWSDRKAMRILKNLREAVGERKDVSLVLIEVNRSGHSSSHVRHWIDFQMLVCCNAQERTPAAWRTLLAATGWRITHTQPTRSMFQIIEVQPEPTVITPTSGQKQQSQQQLKQEL